MNARTLFQYPTLGQPIHGGYFHGVLLLDGKLYGEVSGPKADCLVKGVVWHPEHIDIPGAASDFDGLANTVAMAEAGSPLALAAQACRSGGFDDWHVSARGGLLMQYAARKAMPASEKFDLVTYVSSTQFSAINAFGQYFDYGLATIYLKSWQGGCARFVRRFPIE